MEPKIVGCRIQKLMKLEQISKNKLAEKLDITLEKLERKLNGEEEFYISEIMKIKEIFQLNLDIFTQLFFEANFKLEENILNK